MRTRSLFLFPFLLMLCFATTLSAQSNQVSSTTSTAAASPVPRLIKFSGALLDEQGRPMKSPLGVTFALYAQQAEGAPLWMETQNVEVDAKGNYTVLLGANSNQGVPADLFTSGEARWLGVQAERQPEQPRVLLVSVPYALKAADAETLGGKPFSAFQLVPTPNGNTSSNASSSGPQPVIGEQANEIVCASATACKIGVIPRFVSNGGSATVSSSLITQSGTTIGISGSESVSGSLNLPTTSNRTTGVITMGGNPFIHGFGGNTFLGVNAGNFSMTGGSNTASGEFALQSNMTGPFNTASGFRALLLNTTGFENTASGVSALLVNTTGANNTATGSGALGNNTTGSFNTALGTGAGNTTNLSSTTGNNDTFVGANSNPGTQSALNNATAIGANAQVTESNALVLGSIKGVNGATTDALVGIGITAPTFKLHVGTINHGLRVEGPPIGGSGVVAASFGGNGDFAIDAPGVVAGRFVVKDTSGNVGIGMASPQASLHVVNTSTGNGNHTADFSAPNIGFNHSHIHFGPTGDWYIRSASSGGVVVLQDLGGMVGIGTASPDNLLTVNGSADKPGGGSWGTFSDARLKNLHGEFQAGLAEILKLHPVRYRYKEGNVLGIKDWDEHVGFVAQDVQKVIPEAVSANGQGYLLLNNDPILWTMLNAIKQQQAEIQSLRRSVGAKDAQIQKLTKQMQGFQGLRQQMAVLEVRLAEVEGKGKAGLAAASAH